MAEKVKGQKAKGKTQRTEAAAPKAEKSTLSASGEQQPSHDLVTISVMGEAYQVPKELTIMKAMEYAGFRFIRGCGCRGRHGQKANENKSGHASAGLPERQDLAG